MNTSTDRPRVENSGQPPPGRANLLGGARVLLRKLGDAIIAFGMAVSSVPPDGYNHPSNRQSDSS